MHVYKGFGKTKSRWITWLWTERTSVLVLWMRVDPNNRHVHTEIVSRRVARRYTIHTTLSLAVYSDLRGVAEKRDYCNGGMYQAHARKHL